MSYAYFAERKKMSCSILRERICALCGRACESTVPACLKENALQDVVAYNCPTCGKYSFSGLFHVELLHHPQSKVHFDTIREFVSQFRKNQEVRPIHIVSKYSRLQDLGTHITVSYEKLLGMPWTEYCG